MKQLKIVHQITNRDSSSIEKYFNEISKENMLRPDEEVELARRIKQGDEHALEKLVRANLRFVVSVAKQYHHGSLPLNDLINEGNVGLIKAAKMFDETKGFKFISYAVWWIRQAILQALNEKSRIVRVPANRIGDLSKISQAASVMEQQFEREPTQEELAEYLQVDIEVIKTATNSSIRQSSLNAPFGEDGESSLLDIIEDPNAEPVDAPLTGRDSLKRELERLLAVLSDREQEVIRRLFGIGYEYSLSLEDISADLGLSHERIRQIRNAALKKMRTRSSLHLLRSYLD